jgi:hypothetical protein
MVSPYRISCGARDHHEFELIVDQRVVDCTYLHHCLCLLLPLGILTSKLETFISTAMYAAILIVSAGANGSCSQCCRCQVGAEDHQVTLSWTFAESQAAFFW